MPLAQNIVLALNAGTQTFKPKSVSPFGIFQDDTSATISGRPEITCSHRFARDEVPGVTSLKLTVPVEASVDGVDQVVRENTVFIKVTTAPDSSASERDDLMELASNLLANADIISVVKDGEQFR